MAKKSFYRRKLKTGPPVWYARFKTPDGWTTGKNTGCTTRRDAEAWAEANEYRIITPSIVDTEHPENITFGRASAGFFAWEGPWSMDRRVTGRRHSLRSCREKQELLERHVLPYFRDIPVQDIGAHVLKDFRNGLASRGLSASTINKALIVVRTVLKDLLEREVIDRVPVVAGAATPRTEKEIFSIDEIRRLFAAPWDDIRARAGAMLASTTGCRLGEIQALKVGQVNFEDRYIIVKHSWDERLRVLNATTKGGKARTIFFPAVVAAELRALLDIHPQRDNPEAFLFFSVKTQGKPCEQRIFNRALKKALRSIGINEAERVRRGLNFHSLRHFINTLFVSKGVPVLMIQQMIGHNSISMTEQYLHPRPEDFSEIRRIQDALFEVEDERGAVQ